MISGLAVRWIAETGAGTIPDLRRRLAWLARTTDVQASRRETGAWLRDADSLGLIELDWQAGRWSAAPLVVTRLPGPDGLALVAGPRPAPADAALAAYDPHALTQPTAGGPLDRPDSSVIQYDDGDDLAAIAASIGATLVACASQQLAQLLPPLAVAEAAAPPSYTNNTVESYDTHTGTWTPVRSRSDLPGGLYRLKAAGRTTHLHRDAAGRWHRCDLGTGVHLELRRHGITTIRWHGTSAPGQPDIGNVLLGWAGHAAPPLPALHRRTLVLCSGQLPTRSTAARHDSYPNVPRDVAVAVADALGQDLRDTTPRTTTENHL